jgi:uncharacterized membrane protein YvbJ
MTPRPELRSKCPECGAEISRRDEVRCWLCGHPLVGRPGAAEDPRNREASTTKGAPGPGQPRARVARPVSIVGRLLIILTSIILLGIVAIVAFIGFLFVLCSQGLLGPMN